jgi:Gpi18-like mannosyltransferase
LVNSSFPKREVGILAAMLGVSFLIRALLFPLQGYANDIGTYSYWFNTAAQTGVRPFYTTVLENAGWIDYPPFNVYLFWVFGSLGQAVAGYGISMTAIIKLVPNLFDLATAVVIYFYIRKQYSFKTALTATALYTFNAAIIYNAAVWGQFDAIYTFFLVLSLVLALKSKPYYSAAAFAVALLTKPQGIALAPLLILLIYMKAGVNQANNSQQNSPQKKVLRLKNDIVEAWPKLKILLISIVVFVATIFLVILPFEWSNPVTFLSNIYFGAYSGYQYTSINAFNLWGLFGLWVPDGSLFIVGWAMFAVVAAFTLLVLYKRFNVSGEWLALFAAFMLFFAFFMLPTRIHERYLFPAISILALMYPLIKKVRPLYVALTATLLVNQAYVLYWLNDYVAKGYTYSPNLSGDPVVLAVSAVNLVMFFYATFVLWSELKGRKWLKAERAVLSQSQENGEPI